MKTSKAIGTFLFVIAMVSTLQGQKYQSANTLPLSPSIQDTISIVDSALTFDSGFILYSSQFSIQGYSISITNCYIDPVGFGSIWYKKDTIAIGQLSLGTYTCTLYSRYQLDTPINCNSLPNRDTFTFSFTVSQYPNSISDIDFSTVSIAPNPANNKLTISSPVSDMDITVLDLSGREFNVPHNQSEIDISALASGVYCIRIQNRNSAVIKRFIRE